MSPTPRVGAREAGAPATQPVPTRLSEPLNPAPGAFYLGHVLATVLLGSVLYRTRGVYPSPCPVSCVPTSSFHVRMS